MYSHQNQYMYLLYVSYANDHTWLNIYNFLIFKNGFFYEILDFQIL